MSGGSYSLNGGQLVLPAQVSLTRRFGLVNWLKHLLVDVATWLRARQYSG